jgi:hypothetical protein
VVIAVVVLAVILLAADRITLVVAEHTAANTIRNAQHLDRTPSVTIHGFPFLTQLATGLLGRVDVTASNFTAGESGHTVRISRLVAHLHRVHLNGFSSARAESVTASATIGYPALSSALGFPVRYGGRSSDGLGRVATTQTVSALGQQLTGVASAEVAVRAGNELQFVHPQASVDGVNVPTAISDQIAAVFDRSLAITRLPFGLAVDSVRASTSGVTITLSGRNVTYR